MSNSFDNFNNKKDSNDADEFDQYAIPSEYTGGVDSSGEGEGSSYSPYSGTSGYVNHYESLPYNPYTHPPYSQKDYPHSPCCHHAMFPSHRLHLKSLLGLIFSLIFFPIGLVLSWMAWRETRGTDDKDGRLMSGLGLIISGTITTFCIAVIVVPLLFQLIILLFVLFGASAAG